MGWAVTWIAVAWFLMTFVNLYMARAEKAKARHAMTAKNIAQYDRLQDHRWSAESGLDSATLCSGSRSPSSDSVPQHKFEAPDEEHGDDEDLECEEQGFIQNNPVDRFLLRKVPRISSGRAFTAFKVVFTLIERCMPVLGFVSLLSGGVVFGGIYVSGNNHLHICGPADNVNSVIASSSPAWRMASRAVSSSGTVS